MKPSDPAWSGQAAVPHAPEPVPTRPDEQPDREDSRLRSGEAGDASHDEYEPL